MTIEARLADGRVLNFPDGTDPQVIQATVKRMASGSQPDQLQPNEQEIQNKSQIKISSLQADLDKLNEVRNNPDVLEQVYGGIEGFLAAVSAPVAAIASGIIGGVDTLNPFAEEGAGAARQKQVQNALTFEPQLPSGKAAIRQLASGVEAVSDIGTTAVAGLTAGIGGAITGDPLQTVRSFQDIKKRGVGEVIGSGVAEATGSPLLGSIARVIPEASTSFTGAGAFKTGLKSNFGRSLAGSKKPVDFKKLSASQKQKLIAEEIATGNPNINSVTQHITESGGIATSPASRVAIKELSKFGDEVKSIETVSVLERMSDASKLKVRKGLDVIKKGADEPLFRQENRFSDILGESLAFRARDVARINKSSGELIGKIAKSLKNKKVSISQAKDNFFDSMSELGVKFDVAEDGWVTPDFSRSKFAGGSQKDMNVLVNDLMGDRIGFNSAHELKQSIRQNLNFDPLGTGKITGKSEKILKDLSKGIDEVLDTTSPAYDKANIKFAKTKGMVDTMQKLAGKDIDLFSDSAITALSDKAKRITSNATSRSTIGRDIRELDSVLKDLKITYKDDIQSLIFATNEMERIFDIAPQNSLQGNLLNASQKVARGDLPIAETVGFIKNKLSPSQQKIFNRKLEVLRDLTKLKGKKQ